MSDEADRKDISNFTFISSTTIPPTNANSNQQFTPTLPNQGGNLTPLSAYAYYNDSSGNGAYYFQTNSLQPQPNSFPQQPSATSENFGHPFNSGQPSGYQYNYPIMMDQQLNPYGLMQQEAALGTENVTITNPYHNEQYIFSPSPQPQEMFSSTLNNGQFGTQSPPLFFNNINSNFTGVPNNSTRAESMINQIPQLQRFSHINGNDLNCFSPIPKPIPLPINWSFASRQLNGENEIANRNAAPSNEEAAQNFILRIEQVTLINAVPNDSKKVSFEQVSTDQTSTSIQHKYITDSEGLTILSQVGDNKPQVIKIDMESIKQMLKSNSCFYIQQFLNGPMGKIKNQATTEMQTDGSFHTDIKEIANQKCEPTEVVQILGPKELPAEEAPEDLQKQSSDLVFDEGGVANLNERLFSEIEADSEPEQRTFGENDGPVLDNESEPFP